MCQRLFTHFCFCCNSRPERQWAGRPEEQKTSMPQAERLQRSSDMGDPLITFRLYLEVTWHMLSSWHSSFMLTTSTERVWSMWRRQLYHKVFEINKSMSAIPETILQKQWWRNKNNKKDTLCSTRYKLQARKISHLLDNYILFNDSNVNLTQGDLLLQGISLQK